MGSNLIAMASHLLPMASNPLPMASNLIAMASHLLPMASNPLPMASNLIAMASHLLPMASNPLPMASNLIGMNGFQPNGDDLQPFSVGCISPKGFRGYRAAELRRHIGKMRFDPPPQPARMRGHSNEGNEQDKLLIHFVEVACSNI